MKKYGFKDWWDGEICLNTCLIVTKEDQKRPVIVGWESIVESEKNAIRDKQLEIFQQQIDKKLELLKDDFNKRFKESRLPEIFLEREIELMNQILFGQLQDYGDIFVTTHRNIPFEKQYLCDIQHYAERTLLNGLELTVDFIHSPNSKYQCTDRPPSQVAAEVYWNKLEFLRDFQKNRIDQNVQNLIKEPTNQENPENPYPHIFINGQSYAMFEELRTSTVGNNKNHLAADYGFIFHKMKYFSKEVKSLSLGLHMSVGEAVFINFLRDDLEVDYKSDRLPNRNPDNKQTIYNSILDKYRGM